MVRGVEDGVRSGLGLCKGYKMGKEGEKPHNRVDPIYRATEQVVVIHIDLVRPFGPKSIRGGKKCDLAMIDDCNKISWTILLRVKKETKVLLKLCIAIQEN